eukprot:TRINITY_DN15599_c0_g1_i1.p1 TRINITY_DN15599_c0_g1~~TRINITY_DN15599_c0_g1_i1.p1  ORF type:complete len:152 (+),score=0.74 TRINITY_DN15599_c0_g1_i1:27-458(+)
MSEQRSSAATLHTVAAVEDIAASLHATTEDIPFGPSAVLADSVLSTTLLQYCSLVMTGKSSCRPAAVVPSSDALLALHSRVSDFFSAHGAEPLPPLVLSDAPASSPAVADGSQRELAAPTEEVAGTAHDAPLLAPSPDSESVA